MGAKASTSADPPPEPATPSREHPGSRESSGLAAILADLGRRASLETGPSGRRAQSFSGIVSGSVGAGTTSGPLDTPPQQDGSTPLSEAQSLPLHFMSFNGGFLIVRILTPFISIRNS